MSDFSMNAIIEEAVYWRQHLHRHPELSFKEFQTAEFAAAQLGHFGFTVHRGLASTGVVGTLTRGTSRRSIGIRADMDALPIKEESGAAHASLVPGVMHACGHDGHVAIALAAARACQQLPNLDGTVHFIFQPAEEGAGGAQRMVEEGLFRRFPCDAIYGLHNWPTLPVGTCVASDGPMMAAVSLFEIVISGRGCHGAMPHEGADSLLTGCHLVTALQSIVSRNVDPLEGVVVSITQILAGEVRNAVPDRCVIRGTTRWFDPDVGDLLQRRVGGLTQSIASAFACTVQLDYQRYAPATINHPTAAAMVRRVAVECAKLRVIDSKPSTAAEDFSFMLGEVPGCFLWLGSAKSNSNIGLHSPRYDFNDEALPLGIDLWVSLVRQSLASI
jgi:amidohydrolase